MKPFKSYDELRLFTVVARHQSFTAAAETLHLTKGAVSYLIKQLERDLGFPLFLRTRSGIKLTPQGGRLLRVAQQAFQEIEHEIELLGNVTPGSITIGASTYFASRWLSPRLMTFITQHPDLRLRLQPVIGPGDLQEERIDLMIRWGNGSWPQSETKGMPGWPQETIERLFTCSAIPTGGRAIADQIMSGDLAAVLPKITLLHDREGSPAWREWYHAAGLPYRPRQDSLVIPDPNVRVEAVINGQGIALNDDLISDELASGRLVQFSPVTLPAYGYFLIYREQTMQNPALRAFREWITAEVEGQA